MAVDISTRSEQINIRARAAPVNIGAIAGLLILLASCGFGQIALTREDYSIYSLVLKDIYRHGSVYTGKTDEFVIVSETAGNDYQELLPRKTAGLKADYLARNKTPAPVVLDFRLSYPTRIVSRSDIDSLLERGKSDNEIERARDPQRYSDCDSSWRHFYERFPRSNGYHQFSGVGYSSDRRYAYVEIAGKGGCWDWDQSYLLKWTRHGWIINVAAGGGGVS